MDNQDCAAQTLAKIYDVEYVDEHYDDKALALLRAYGQERFHAGVEAAASLFEEHLTRLWRECDIGPRIHKLLVEQGEK